MIVFSVKKVLNEFRLELGSTMPTGSVTAVSGHSGAGKSTFLRWIAGLEPDAVGYLSVGGSVWQDCVHKIFVPTHRRGVGYVFQEPSLFAHLSVRENILLGARYAQKLSIGEIEELNQLLGVAHLLDRYPAKLSGGEMQRVAIARAIGCAPKLLLLDEPTSSLDLKAKEEVFACLETLKNRTKIPMILVSHDFGDVERLADFHVEISKGKLVRAGEVRRPTEIHGKVPRLLKIAEGQCHELLIKFRAEGLKVATVAYDALEPTHERDLQHCFRAYDVVLILRGVS